MTTHQLVWKSNRLDEYYYLYVFVSFVSDKLI